MKTFFILLSLLTLPALAQPWQKPILVVPGKSLGPIELGKPVPKSAFQLLGPAIGDDQVLANQSKDGAGLEWSDKNARMGDPYIRVKCHDGVRPENVYEIFWTASGPRTQAGVGVGSPLAKVLQSFPKGSWTKGMDDAAVWQTSGLNLTFDSQKTRVVEMHLLQAIPAQPLALFDGRAYLKTVAQPDSSTSSVVREEVRRRSHEAFLQKRLAHLAGANFEEEFEVRGCARGRFTAGAATQTAVLYRYSYTDGVVILEDGKVVAHYSGDPGDYAHYTGIAAAPDIQKNGLEELILFRNVEDSADIYAYFFDGGSYLGAATVFSSNLRGGDEMPAAQIRDTAYVVQVQPGSKPDFSRVTYQRGKNTSWKLVRASSPFSLDRTQSVTLKRIDGP